MPYLCYVVLSILEITLKVFLHNALKLESTISFSIMPLVYGPIGALHYPWYNFQYKNLDHVTYFHQWEFIILVNFTQGATQGALTQLTKYMMYIYFLTLEA